MTRLVEPELGDDLEAEEQSCRRALGIGSVLSESVQLLKGLVWRGQSVELAEQESNKTACWRFTNVALLLGG